MKKEEKLQMRVFHFVTAAWPFLDGPVTNALLTLLDDQWLDRVSEDLSHEDIYWNVRRIQDWRKRVAKEAKAKDPVNLPAEALLDDYAERRKGRIVEARKQLRRRFDGLDHDMQFAVAEAFLYQDCKSDRDFIYGKLVSGVFWDDSLQKTVESLWERTGDRKLAVVVARRARKEFVRAHFSDLEHWCPYADLCIGVGEVPDKMRMSPWTYLFVMSRIGGKLKPMEGRRIILDVIRDYIHSDEEKPARLDVFDIPHVSRMLLYLGALKEFDEICAIQRVATAIAKVPEEDWEGIIADSYQVDASKGF